MMQLRSGKKIGQEQGSKSSDSKAPRAKLGEKSLKNAKQRLKSKTPTSFNECVFVSHMKHLLNCVQDAPSRTMEKLGRMHELMRYISLDVNSEIAHHPKFCKTVISKCNELQHDLLAMVAETPQLTAPEHKTVMQLHDLMAEIRTKYQGYASDKACWQKIQIM